MDPHFHLMGLPRSAIHRTSSQTTLSTGCAVVAHDMTGLLTCVPLCALTNSSATTRESSVSCSVACRVETNTACHFENSSGAISSLACSRQTPDEKRRSTRARRCVSTRAGSCVARHKRKRLSAGWRPRDWIRFQAPAASSPVLVWS